MLKGLSKAQRFCLEKSLHRRGSSQGSQCAVSLCSPLVLSSRSHTHTHTRWVDATQNLGAYAHAVNGYNSTGRPQRRGIYHVCQSFARQITDKCFVEGITPHSVAARNKTCRKAQPCGRTSWIPTRKGFQWPELSYSVHQKPRTSYRKMWNVMLYWFQEEFIVI